LLTETRKKTGRDESTTVFSVGRFTPEFPLEEELRRWFDDLKSEAINER
jgi:hypothetical protein